MRNFLGLFFLIFALFAFIYPQKVIQVPNLPVCLVYRNAIPDSIKIFLKSCLKKNKVKVIESNELSKLVADEMSSVANNYINSKSSDNAERFLKNQLRTVGNTLSMEFFFRQKDDTTTTIDRISWKIFYSPSSDTVYPVRRIFINADTTENNSFVLLKKFIAEVLASKYLK
ncbi:MAG: hypothetical protein JST23_08835 [Bacteroidetes bacterium]|nr:hypothetical protein [Bacteroidota bacterium]